MKSKRLLNIFGEIDHKHILEAAPANKKARNRSIWIRWGVPAACMLLVLSAFFGSFAIAAEAKEYKAAVQFFHDYDLSTEGLTRREIKAVYRDITTNSFTHSKTARVIRNSIPSDYMNGYYISPDGLAPEEIEKLWNYKNFTCVTPSTGLFTYGGEDVDCYIADKIEYKGTVYWSVYVVPRLAEGEPAYGREIASVLNYLFQNHIWHISSEELTPMVRDNYTALLLKWDPIAGEPKEIHSVKGALGSTLSVGEEGTLLWNVESIETTYFSPATSSFNIGGSCDVYRYTFDDSGLLIGQERTGETVDYRR